MTQTCTASQRYRIETTRDSWLGRRSLRFSARRTHHGRGPGLARTPEGEHKLACTANYTWIMHVFSDTFQAKVMRAAKMGVFSWSMRMVPLIQSGPQISCAGQQVRGVLKAMLLAQETCICGHWRRLTRTERPARSICGAGPDRPRMGSIKFLHGNSLRVTYSCVGLTDSNSHFVF